MTLSNGSALRQKDTNPNQITPEARKWNTQSVICCWFKALPYINLKLRTCHNDGLCDADHFSSPDLFFIFPCFQEGKQIKMHFSTHRDPTYSSELCTGLQSVNSLMLNDSSQEKEHHSRLPMIELQPFFLLLVGDTYEILRASAILESCKVRFNGISSKSERNRHRLRLSVTGVWASAVLNYPDIDRRIPETNVFW